jgi:hypothetical protein
MLKNPACSRSVAFRCIRIKGWFRARGGFRAREGFKIGRVRVYISISS